MLSYSNAIIGLIIIAGFVLLGTAILNVEEYPKQLENSAPLENNPQNFQTLVSAELSDKCATPDGYTDETWRQHMSHHPDRYEGCL